MAVVFNQAVKHGALQFIPGPAVAFEDSGAEAYFIAMGWADSTNDAPGYTYPEGSVVIDPLTRRGDTGEYVQPDLAQAHLDEHDGEPPPPPHELAFRGGLIAPEESANG